MARSNDIEKEALALFERSLDYPAKARAAMIQAWAPNNPALRERALAYLSRDETAKSAFHTGGALVDTLDDTAIPEQIGAYKITSLIGRGGMGAVYRGERASGDFNHDVAIKVIRPGAMSDKLIARFENERQTLANLSHPNIARLYDGGTLGNKAPYIVMEYIDGLPITIWADKNKLPLASRLSLFKAACTAVSHAHQNLIVHRDITPSNVLVDASGQVKLIDFGIAKPFDENAVMSEGAQSLASLSFTPGFAAPERSNGAGANTLSDVYSLGKILGGLIPPQDISAELRSIIYKSTQTDPEERYTSVEALLSDVSNYQSNFPVKAFPQSRIYKIKKFIGRHTLGTVMSSLLVTVIIGALITTSLLYSKAETERKNADARFSETRELANFMMFDLFDKVADVDGTTNLQELLASESQVYLEALSNTPRSTSKLQFELAQGLHRLAAISGGPERNIGQPSKATKLYEDSMQEFDRLLADFETDSSFMEAYLDAMDDYGFFAFMALDDGPLTSQVTERFDVIIRKMIAEDPENLSYRMRRAAMLGLRGENFGWLNEFDNGRETLDQALVVIEEAENKFGKNSKIDSRAARIFKAYSELEHKAGLQNLGDQKLAVEYADKGIALLKNIGRDRNLTQLRSDEENLFYLYYSQTVAYQAMPNYQKSAETANQALEYIDRLIETNPDNFTYKRSKYYLENALSQTYVELGNNLEAQNTSEAAVSSVSKALEDDIDSPMILTDYGTILGESAAVFQLIGDPSKSCALATRALDVFDRLLARQQINPYHKDTIIPKIQITKAENCK